jgi:Histidine kinase-, DNA gyrase B-, and HSP90-like ATPase
MRQAADDLVKISDKAQTIAVGISNEVVTLLSQQLYQSPLKAIEELVVNSYDAEATHCRLSIPDPAALRHDSKSVIGVFDDGLGLSDKGMINLWHVGRSDKRTEEIARRAKRTQIGKFGIGKLAVFVISNQLSYVSKSDDRIWFSSLDFREFHEESNGRTVPVKIDLRTIRDLDEFKSLPWVAAMIRYAGIDSGALDSPHWTLAILEDFKEKAWDIKLGRLKWVLRTAMPLRSGFQLFLNKDEIKSSKEDIPVVASFKITELDEERWAALNERTGDDWRVADGKVVSSTFTTGITGEAMVTERTLPGKSDDILRSNGFFIRVRGRLIAQEEPFFGMNPLYHGTLNRLRADIEADDLDAIIKAPREEIEASPMREKFEAFLREVFQEARNRWDNYQRELAEKEERKKESERSFVSSEIIERPIAGAIVRTGGADGADGDRTWFYLATAKQDWKALAEELYAGRRQKFSYEYRHLGTTERIIKFHVDSRRFVMNIDHEFIAANSGDELSKTFLHDFVLAEVVLEARLRLASISPAIIGEILQDRDSLLRSLAKDHPFSSQAVAQQLRDSVNNQYDLEIALVAAARALGFVTKHVSGAGQPDAVARLVEYPRRDIVLTIEAKSSDDVPKLPQLDFAGLREHMKPYRAVGCLLVAPAYPGSGNKSQVHLRSREQKVSCWTVDQLARVVENIEARHITARQIAEIVSTTFDPASVEAAIIKLLSDPAWDRRTLRSAVLAALDALEARMEDRPRSVDMVATEVSRDAAFQGISVEDTRKALAALASISQGALQVDGDTLVLFTSVNEIRRRVQPQLAESAQPRRISTVREDLPSKQSNDKGH